MHQTFVSKKLLPHLPDGYYYRLDLSRAATPRLLRQRPVHRWFYFPHSYSPELVENILKFWNLPQESIILDPFVGAGTTLRVAQEHGFRAVGTDLSPIAELASKVKTRVYDLNHLRKGFWKFRQQMEHYGQKYKIQIPENKRLKKAFTLQEWTVLFQLRKIINSFDDEILRDFFLLALLSIISEFSRAVADGGWFRWIDRPNQAEKIVPRLWQEIEKWLCDFEETYPIIKESPSAEFYLLDSRDIKNLSIKGFNAVITSPPYPNRHDYTRVFQIELLLFGYSEEEIFKLRHQSLRSHVEAKTPTITKSKSDFKPPDILKRYLAKLPENADKRICRMMIGYFHDMYLFLQSARNVLAPGARLALVVGNVRHAGVLFPVDEILMAVAEQAGYHFDCAWVIRLRGNSAQQMGRFGRIPSRETIVMLKLPTS